MTVAEQQTITETVELVCERQQIDAKAGVIKGVKILGRESKNNRVYPAATIERAKGLYEGKKVNVNHPRGEDVTRNYEERFGFVNNVIVRDGELYGDLNYNPKHAVAEQFAWDAEHAPGQVGLSHNVNGRIMQENGRDVVEEILNVISVDIVADPASTQGLFEGETMSKKTADKPSEKTSEKTTEAVDDKEPAADAAEKVSEAEKAKTDTPAATTETVELVCERQQIGASEGEIKRIVGEAVREAVAGAIKEERERDSELTALCEAAGMPQLARKFIDAGTNLGEAKATILDAKLKREGAGDGGEDPELAEADENAKFKAEFAEHRQQYLKSGVTEEDFLRTRRIDEGLERLEPKPKEKQTNAA